MCTTHSTLKNEPIWQKTRLGWIIGGEIKNSHKCKTSTCHLITNETLSKQLERFWMIEDIEDRNEVNQLDPCEQHFTSTVLQQDGRYVVSLPKNSEI